MCIRDRVLSVKDAGLLLADASEGRPPQKLYEQFREELDRALDVTAGSLDGSAEAEELPGLALALSLIHIAGSIRHRVSTQKEAFCP